MELGPAPRKHAPPQAVYPRRLMGVWGFYRATWSIPGRIFGAVLFLTKTKLTPIICPRGLGDRTGITLYHNERLRYMQTVDKLTVHVVVDNITDMLSTRPKHVASELRILMAAGMTELAGEASVRPTMGCA